MKFALRWLDAFSGIQAKESTKASSLYMLLTKPQTRILLEHIWHGSIFLYMTYCHFKGIPEFKLYGVLAGLNALGYMRYRLFLLIIILLINKSFFCTSHRWRPILKLTVDKNSFMFVPARSRCSR